MNYNNNNINVNQSCQYCTKLPCSHAYDINIVTATVKAIIQLIQVHLFSS